MPGKPFDIDGILNIDIDDAKHTMSDFTKNHLKKLEKMKINPLSQMTEDLGKTKAALKKVTDEISRLKGTEKEIPIKISDTQAKKQIAALQQELTELNEKRSNLETKNRFAGNGKYDNEIQNTLDKIIQIEDRLAQLDKGFDIKLVNAEDTKQFKDLVTLSEQLKDNETQLEKAVSDERLNSVKQEREALEKALAARNKYIDALKQSPTYIEAQISEVDGLINKYKNLRSQSLKAMALAPFADKAIDTTEFNDINAKIKDLIAEKKKLEEPIRPKITLKDLDIDFKKFIGNVNSYFKEIGESVKNAGKLISNIRKIAGKIGNTFKKLTTNSKKAFNLGTVLKYALGIRSLYTLFNKLKSAGKEGLNNVAKFSAPLQTSINQITGAFNQMKNATGAAIAPLANALAPVIMRIASLFTAAANAVARFFAVLTGQRRVVQATNNQNAYAAALDKTAGSAGKASKALAAFDDLDVLDTDTGGGSGAGDIGGGIAEMFEDVEASNTLADMIRNAWASDDVLAAFEDVGRYIGEWLKNALDDALINFWPQAQEFAKKIAQAIAGTINGYVNTPGLAQSIGENIAAAINTAIIFLSNFWNGIRWADVGKFVYNGISSTINNINWSELGAYLSGKFNGIITFLANAVGDGAWIYDLSYRLGEALRIIITEVDWLSLIQTMFAAGASLIQGLWDGIWGNQPEFKLQSYNAIEQAFVDNEGNIWAIGNDGGITLVKGIADGITGTAEEAELAFNNIKENIQGSTDEVVTGVLQKTGYTQEQLAAALGIIQFDIDTQTGAIVGTIQERTSILSDDITTKTDGIKQNAVETTQTVSDTVSQGLADVSKTTNTKLSEVTKLYDSGAKNNYDRTLKGLQNINADTLKYLTENSDLIADSLDAISEKVTETTESIAEVVTKLLNEEIKDLIKSFLTWIDADVVTSLSNSGDKIYTNFKSMINNLIGALQKLSDAAASAADAVAASINNLRVDIPSWVPNYGGYSWNPHLSGGVRTSLPKLATGAVLPPNQPFLAMLGDQKKGTNIEAPLDTIVEAMQQALSSMNYNGGQEIVLNIDGTALARLTVPNTLNELNRQGYNVRVLENKGR